MGTTAQKLQNIVDTKAALSALIKDNGGTVPTEFRKYPDTLSTMIGGTGGYSLDDVLELTWLDNVISSDTCKRISNGALAFKPLKELHLKIATHIDNWGCNGCPFLSVLNLPEVTWVGQYAFEECMQIKRVDATMMPKVTSFGYKTFFKCNNLSAVELPTLTSVGESCFASCSRLSVFNCPSLKSVDKYAFQSTLLEHIDFPECSGPRENAFRSMSYLTDAKLNGLTILEPNIFSYCYQLTSVYMNSLVHVNYNIPSYNSPFNNCSRLVEVHMPKYSGAEYNIDKCSQQFFSYCPNTLSVYFNEKTMAEIKALHDYPFAAKAGMKFICKDGTITI